LIIVKSANNDPRQSDVYATTGEVAEFDLHTDWQYYPEDLNLFRNTIVPGGQEIVSNYLWGYSGEGVGQKVFNLYLTTSGELSAKDSMRFMRHLYDKVMEDEGYSARTEYIVTVFSTSDPKLWEIDYDT